MAVFWPALIVVLVAVVPLILFPAESTEILNRILAIITDGLGWGGQFPLIVPELGLIAVFTGWNIYEEEQYEYAFQLFYDRIILSADR